MDDFLVCVGCGSRVCRRPQKEGLAISCRCGAYSPIFEVEGTGELYGLPASLMMAVTSGKTPAHLEYYLGRSSHTSPIKTAVEHELRKLGAISEDECEECRKRIIETGIQMAGGDVDSSGF